MSTDDVFPE